LGDAFHNFFDGVMIALAFKHCSMSTGWTVMGAMIAHECPQEIADFLILLNSGMNIYQAAFCNFVSALSAILGVIVMLSIQNISNPALGYLLTINAGIFTFVGAEMAMNFVNYKGSLHAKVGLILSFILGTLVIGITTANAPHEHCDANGDHDHDHGHGHDH
jgi:zinc transporter ZupT